VRWGCVKLCSKEWRSALDGLHGPDGQVGSVNWEQKDWQMISRQRVCIFQKDCSQEKSGEVMDDRRPHLYAVTNTDLGFDGKSVFLHVNSVRGLGSKFTSNPRRARH
jgi:hypothetical protein